MIWSYNLNFFWNLFC